MTEPRGCFKFEIDDSKYSTFVPVIGTYVAGISLVCLLAMIYDICLALRHKKKWLPCKLFSMNSLTLTLLAIAAKLPVDLTTPMPSGLDQFSKLCGNGFICVSMGFLSPSLGLTSNHDSMTNMLALFVFCVTLVVNTCLQIRAGVIFLFVAEHIIIMCCLLLMLYSVWWSICNLAAKKGWTLDHDKNLMREGQGSMLQRLELVYLYSFNHNPQFAITSYKKENYQVSGLCMICSVTLVQAAIRNLSLKFCGGTSDYGWSIWVIVLAQILTALLGTFASMLRSWGSRDQEKTVGSDKKMQVSFPKFLLTIVDLLEICWCAPVVIAVHSVNLLLITGLDLISHCVYRFSWLIVIIANHMFVMISTCHKQKEDIDVKEYGKLIVNGGGMSLTESGLLEGVKDMKRLMEMGKSQSMKNLAHLLLKIQPSQPFHTMKGPNAFFLQDTLQVSIISFVNLLHIARSSLPPQLTVSLIQVYREVHDIIEFIADTMCTNNSADREELEWSKSLWLTLYERNCDTEEIDTEEIDDSSLEETEAWFFSVLEKIKLEPYLFQEKMLAVTQFIEDGHPRSAENRPFDFIQQMFADMLHIFLAQLPRALCKHLDRSSPEGFYESVKTSLLILRKIQVLETHMRLVDFPIKWSFPEEYDICDLIAPQTDSLDVHVDIARNNVSPEGKGDVIVEIE